MKPKAESKKWKSVKEMIGFFVISKIYLIEFHNVFAFSKLLREAPCLLTKYSKFNSLSWSTTGFEIRPSSTQVLHTRLAIIYLREFPVSKTICVNIAVRVYIIL